MKVVVVGAGYAGTMAANKVAAKVRGAQVTMVNPRAEFVERVRLHQQVAGTCHAATPLAEMVGDRVTTLVGSVDEIGDGTVTMSDGTGLEFDYLFVAVGSTVDPLPGTVAVGTWEGAQDAREQLERLAAGAVVTVVGGGLTGLETAAEIAEARTDLTIRLVSSTVGESLSEGGRQRARSGLARLGVEIVSDTVTAAADGEVILRSGTRLPSDLTLWAVMGTIPDLVARSGLPVDDAGRALVDEYLRSVNDERIFVVGDCAAVPGARAACATAVPQGTHAANTLARISRNRKPAPYSMGYVGQAVSLGRRDSVIQVTRRDDSPRRAYLSGRTGAALKEAIVRGAKAAPRTGIYAWMPGKK
ncbi:NAD(P)/FAD-dependent oxidoreductase [Nocardia stercoris]|uniref:Dehydrogenase n=1 Tax=Nocardia stercoris TaxID=2483361 RepID=A0A3M2L9L3_9NOCA|nr:FAD-dependent oxidoreductase [Nocardia stercoris]RMI34289.1 dehydrogenase [Nocardia stercoris]